MGISIEQYRAAIGRPNNIKRRGPRSKLLSDFTKYKDLSKCCPSSNDESNCQPNAVEILTECNYFELVLVFILIWTVLEISAPLAQLIVSFCLWLLKVMAEAVIRRYTLFISWLNYQAHTAHPSGSYSHLWGLKQLLLLVYTCRILPRISFTKLIVGMLALLYVYLSILIDNYSDTQLRLGLEQTGSTYHRPLCYYGPDKPTLRTSIFLSYVWLY